MRGAQCVERVGNDLLETTGRRSELSVAEEKPCRTIRDLNAVHTGACDESFRPCCDAVFPQWAHEHHLSSFVGRCTR